MSLSKSSETRVLFLKSYDINPSNDPSTYFSLDGTLSVQTEQGIVADNRNSLTWFNVNLRLALGDTYYNKYNKFHIRLNSFWCGQTATSTAVTTPTSAVAAATDARSVDIYLHNLAFEPSPYAQASMSKNSGKAFIANVLLPAVGSANAGVVYNFAEGSTPSYTFSKTADNVNLTIQMLQATSQTPYIPSASTHVYGHSSFNFEIHGVDEVIN